MAVVRRTLSDIKASRPKLNRELIEAITDEEIDAMIASDPDLAPDMSEAELQPEPRFIRAAAGVTQEQFAKLLRIPVATLRNWEQNGPNRNLGPPPCSG